MDSDGSSVKRVLLAAILVVAIVSPAAGSPIWGFTPGRIDSGLFISTVPPAMTLGQAYHVQVYVTDNSTVQLKGIVVLEYPTQYFFSDKSSQVVDLAPGDTKLFEFNLVAANPHIGSMTVAAALFITTGTHPSQSFSVSTTVYSIERSPVVGQVAFYIVVALLAAGGLYALSVVLKTSRKPPG
jgi:hypothetical protein